MRKLVLGFVLIVALFTATLAYADYTGPANRTQTTAGCNQIIRNYDDMYICSFPKGGVNYPNCGQHCGDASNVDCDAVYCNAIQNGSTAYRVESQGGGTITLPNATISAVFQCGTWGNNGWCRGGGVLHAEANEPVSGYVITAIETNTWGYICQPNTASPTCDYALPDGQGTVSVWAESSWGDSSGQTTATWKVDAVAPTASPSVSGTLGSNGWYIANPVVQSNAADATSGVDVVEYQVDSGAWQNGASATLSSDGVHTVAFRVTDLAGNVLTTSPVTVRVDTTPPVIVPSIPSPNGHNGWFVTSPVGVDATGSDATSGLSTLECRVDGGTWASPPVNVSGDGGHIIECQAKDAAGNTSLWSGSVQIDATAPVANLSVSGTAGNNGWYVSSAIVSANAADTTSGVDIVEYRVDGGTWQNGNSATLSADGTHTVVFRVTDQAGNVLTTSTQMVNIDTVAPTIVPSVPSPDGQNGWFVTSPVHVNVSANDTTSGLSTLQCRIDGGAWQTPPVDVSGDGSHDIECRAEDRAGNTAVWSETVKIDATAPVLAPTMSAPDGQNGWFVSPATVSANAADTVSGVASVEHQVDGARGKTAQQSHCLRMVFIP